MKGIVLRFVDSSKIELIANAMKTKSGGIMALTIWHTMQNPCLIAVELKQMSGTFQSCWYNFRDFETSWK